MSKARLSLLALVLLLAQGLARGEEPKPEDNSPQVLVTLPLTLLPGQPQKLVIRGLKLAEASEVRLDGLTLPVNILSKGAAAVPDKFDAAAAGDTQVEVELTLPAETPPGSVSLVVVTPGGASSPREIAVLAADQFAAAVEPNAGFGDAQPITIGQAIEGMIGEPRDVDVFRLPCQAGQRLVIETEAARLGSVADTILTLYDGQGRILAVSDDFGENTDSRIDFTVPADGEYFIALIDAHDRGGPVHVYRLVVRLED
ncbi:MAG: PPC domain-containing protein [Pirellulales bacterium]